VATNEDPDTARLDESVYYFYLRTLYQSHVNSWQREVERIKKEHGQKVSWVLLVALNKMTFYFIVHLAINMAVYYVFGWSSFKYQITYMIGGQFILEIISYMEHYGLQRKKD